MKMNNTSSISKSISDNLIDLYTRIPDYSEVQHLGQSDFINTLEKLKEEFRQCRASLYNEEFCSDSEYLAERSSPINNRSRTTENLYCYSSNKYDNRERQYSSAVGERSFPLALDDGNGKLTKINNHNLTTTLIDSSAGRENIAERDTAGVETGERRAGGQFLSIKSCELHRIPYRSTSASSLAQPGRYLIAYGRPFGGENVATEKNDTFQNQYDDDDDDDDEYENNNGPRVRGWSVASSNSDISISKWSSSPEIYPPRSKSREHLPPSNVEQRLLQRKSQNNSAPSVAFKEDTENEPRAKFKANPVPDHVYKPLYEFIMLKNQRRSERVREQSKRRLLAQVKPFSFCKDTNKSSAQHHGRVDRVGESLNNTKPPKKRRNDALGNIKTNNNRLNSSCSTALFRAKPAPPRTKALLAAIRQKEQQEYRELKKRLRSEILLKNASLPPSMAAREKRTKLTNAKIEEVLNDYQKSFRGNKGKGRNFRETSTGTDDTGLLTDDDRMTEDDFSTGAASTRKITTIVKPFKFSQRTPRKFTSFGTSRHSAAALGVFEASSNDNHASRLRYEAAKRKEQLQIKREEEELLRAIKAERRQQKLRDTHLHAWQHACSYSAEQDISMRRQLRHAASILERETFIKDMSCMLSRVRSAPLLLEGGHRLERRQEPCRKHREEFAKHASNSDGAADRSWNKLSTPRLYNWSGSGRKNRSILLMDRYDGEEKSETIALAEGSLSDSDNESSDHDDDEDDENNGQRNRPADSLHTDSGASDLEEDGNEHIPRKVDEIKGEMVIKGGNGGGSRKTSIEAPAPETDDEINDEADEGNEEGPCENDNLSDEGKQHCGASNEIIEGEQSSN